MPEIWVIKILVIAQKFGNLNSAKMPKILVLSDLKN